MPAGKSEEKGEFEAVGKLRQLNCIQCAMDRHYRVKSKIAKIHCNECYGGFAVRHSKAYDLHVRPAGLWRYLAKQPAGCLVRAAPLLDHASLSDMVWIADRNANVRIPPLRRSRPDGRWHYNGQRCGQRKIG
jgi:hypothetical protein